jgi:hypothetical protein
MTDSDIDRLYKLISDGHTENKKDHDAILSQQKITNGTVRDLKNEVFSPECPSDGLVSRIREMEYKQSKLDKRLFRFMVIYSVVISLVSIIAGWTGSQWIEEVLRNKPDIMDGVLRFFINFITSG